MIDQRKGTLHAANAILTTIMCDLPAKIDTANSEQSATIQAMRSSPYVFAKDSGLDLTVKLSATPVEFSGTIPAGSYTAAELAAVVGSLPGFAAADMEAGTRFNGRVFEMHAEDRGETGSLIVGNGSANAVLGIFRGQEFRYYPLEMIEWARCAAVDDIPPVAKALIVEVESQDVDADENEYTITCRLFTRHIAYSAGISHQAMRLALEYGQLVKEIIEESVNLMSASDGHQVVTLTPGFAATENNIQGFCDVTITVNVEEER